jgi:cell division protein FtsQ
MWDDAARLKTIANLLFAIAAAAALYCATHYVVHLPIFPLREIQVTGEAAHLTQEQVQAVIARELRGNFFTIDLAQARAGFEKLPWVRKVNVRRHWPDRLEIVMEEHRPLARWGSTALVNAQGEVFEAAINSVLPVFISPDEMAAEVVGRYAEFEQMVAPMQRKITQIRVSPRRAWQLKLDDGMVIELGRDNLDTRLAAFVNAYARAVVLLPQAPLHVDLRYSNGFAVRSPGLKWAPKKT